MGSTTVQPPATPQAPSTAEGIKAWADTMPQVYETQMRYAPQQAAQDVSLMQQYAGPLAQAQYNAQAQIYPTTSGLQEQLAGQAQTGMTAGLQDWEKQMYTSNLNAQLGNQAGSGIGADYMSRNMLQAQQGRQDYYQNMALSLAGRQPLTQASQPQTADYMTQYTPNAVLGQQSTNYGNYANANASLYGSSTSMYSPGGLNLGILGRWGSR